MRPIFARFAGAVLLAAAAYLPLETRGQVVGGGVSYSRPAEYGPSHSLGLIGGRYTQYNIANLESPNMGVATLPSRNSGIRRLTPMMGYQTSNFQFGPLAGNVGPRYRGAYGPGYTPPSPWNAYGVTGLAGANRLDTPLTGWGGYGRLNAPRQPLPREAPAETRFQEFFGLTPEHVRQYDDTRSGDSPQTFLDDIEELEKRIAFHEQDTRAAAMQAFSDATKPGLDTPEDPGAQYRLMRHSARLLKTASTDDAEDYITPLLLVHAALAQGHVSLALEYLSTAVERNPQLFQDRPELASYFGDFDPTTGRSAFLDQQMRLYFGHTESLSGALLQAYCAWAQADARRLRIALEEAEKQLTSESGLLKPRQADDWALLVSALRYSL